MVVLLIVTSSYSGVEASGKPGAVHRAFLATGIGALIAGVAMGGVWIYNNWSGLQAFFAGFWSSFRTSLGPAAPMLDGIADAVKRLWTWFGNLMGPLDATRDEWTAWGNGAGQALGGFVGKLSQWTGINGQVLGSIAAVYAGFAALKYIWWLPMTPIIGAGKLLAWVAKGPIKWLLSGVSLLAKGFVRLGVLAMANPIGLIIASVAALAYAVYDNWDKIVGAVIEKVDLVRAAFDEGIIKGVVELLAEFNPFTLAVEGAIGLVAYVMELLGVPDQIIAKFKEFSQFATGVTFMKSLWDGMASIVDQLVTFITNKLKDLKPQWLTDLQNWASGGDGPATPAARAHPLSGSAAPRVQGNRDSGGPVLPGLSYLIGERREPEVFVPNLPGNILPARALRAARTAAAAAKPVARMVRQAASVQNTAISTRNITRISQALKAAAAPRLPGQAQLLRAPGTLAGILPRQAMKAAAAATAMAVPAAALPSKAEIQQRIDPRPALSAQAPAPQVTREGDVFTINVYPQPGQDSEAIGREVMRQLKRRDSDRRADLHDGLDY
ncbi:hypothetical protein K3555_05805 [Leisingera sp. M527]|uniref:hypothetical protein n=1 Tax=Leisingera sp. M527 TaxID=2867014 RepID=UPI0021A94BD9|nr:hypothetical protein [Leisingera sp. M527]UWQ34014.1 hypothetical protein K3555_05805 [Leisingera sp. M527]